MIFGQERESAGTQEGEDDQGMDMEVHGVWRL